ncbi:phage portal protein [Mycolicibacterium smegmatis]|uniref:phage portal protein n=1 Tax=Mycolicibacterium smegmatis TaxID=1772 RepID=UPI0005D969A3|nr:phage portal protein [Mycolicibacterium smegmatis]MDF1902745.1 phage portal protein [Mycolicibacterium smegmatis]MDF1909021.1 phage portal protein [Mycolicibacterium smegmatis]MDF1921240.1 phage portal protein [Mycolicibacterium smegmatis]MDF1927505.1 phage portal protein [Mycolicibacterium smegmatis]UAK53362.1 phage portal protein [Mycolicibacterium smegmatis]
MTLALNIPGLSPADRDTLHQLVQQLENKRARNALRSQYYDGKALFKDLGISTPPKFRNFEAVLGWPAKAVDSLSRRCILEGFVIPGQSSQDLGIEDMWFDNALDIEVPQAHDSAFIHSCAFVTTIRGDVRSGEPEVLIMVRDAFNATGLWNPRRRGFDAGLSIVERDKEGAPLYIIMYLPEKVLILTRDYLGGPWRIAQRPNPLGRVPMEPITYRPRLGYPFGKSRITRPVMYITDAAIRTVVRSEIGAEFFTAPQRYGLNIPEDAFANGGWNALMGRFLALEPPSPDEEVDPNFKPEVGQFPQMTMQPHSEQLRQWAALFAAETSIPVSSLGVVQDNPSSAEALYASKEEMVIEAESATRVFGIGWCRAMRNALMVRDNTSELSDEYRKLRAKWRNPSTPSQAAAADAVTKQLSVLPWMAESEVVLEQLGYDRTDIDRLVADRRRSTVSNILNVIQNRANQQATPEPTAQQESSEPTE